MNHLDLGWLAPSAVWGLTIWFGLLERWWPWDWRGKTIRLKGRRKDYE